MTTFFKIHKKKIISSICGLILIISLIVANLFANFIVPTQSESQSISNNAFEFYLISMAKSQVKNEAISRAEDFQKMGAGGYVWEDEGYYHVISSGYLNKNDAQLVQNSIKLNQNLDSELLTINFNEYDIYGNFNEDEKKVVLNLVCSCVTFYTSLYDIAISIDTGVLNETSAKLAVNSAFTNFTTTLANFNTIYPMPHPQNFTDLYNTCILCYESGEKLCQEKKLSDSQNYSSLIKYRYLEIMRLFYEFCST